MNSVENVLAVGVIILIYVSFLIMFMMAIWENLFKKFVDNRVAKFICQDNLLFFLKSKNSWLHPELNESCKGTLTWLGGNNHWRGRCALVMTPTEFIIYVPFRELFVFAFDQLQWVIPPSSNFGPVVLHIEKENNWYLFQIHLNRTNTGSLLLWLKRRTTSGVIAAYRNPRHPYQYSKLLKAYPATQDIHGVWTLAEPVNLYLMPRFLVIFEQARVVRKIPVKAIHQITAKRRLDTNNCQGLVSFNAEQETFIFALKNYENFARILAETSRSWFEEALAQKQKKSDDWDVADFDESDPDTRAL